MEQKRSLEFELIAYGECKYAVAAVLLASARLPVHLRDADVVTHIDDDGDIELITHTDGNGEVELLELILAVFVDLGFDIFAGFRSRDSGFHLGIGQEATL